MWVFHNHGGVKQIHEKEGGVEKVVARKTNGASHWNSQFECYLSLQKNPMKLSW